MMCVKPFPLIDNILWLAKLAGPPYPATAGIRYLPPIRRKVDIYPGLLSISIAGNQDFPDLRAIREDAYEIAAASPS